MKAILNKMVPRGNDPTGHGYYGAKRGTRKHKGFDAISKPDELIKSPIHGTITKLGYPYANALQFRYIEVTNDVYRVRLMYVEPLNILVGKRVFEGQEIGKAQNIAAYWNPKMINHVHIEVYKNGLLTDPEPLFDWES